MLQQISGNIDVGKLLKQFKKTTLLVVGDIMIDEFIWGTVSRISPEAPVPVVAVTHENLLLGGAANVVHNVHSLGGRVLLAGLVGDDLMGKMIKELLAEQGINKGGLVEEAGRPTTVKTRIIAHSQQVVRFDRESRDPISTQSQEQIIDYIDKHWGRVDGVIIADYGKGLIIPDLMDFMEVGNHLLERFASEAILITRGEEGMALFERDGAITAIPTVAKEVYDVTGAGDTVISALTLALAAGSTFPEAAVLANYAAGIVVGKVGTATVTPEELKKAFAGRPRSS
jgi:bifunctional ADP-heptose synthase (sugar kinase/adenylyltransferase)